MSDLVFLVAMGAAIYNGAPSWAIILSTAILVGIHMILAAMTEVGREADRQVADLKSQLKALREPPKAVSDYGDY